MYRPPKMLPTAMDYEIGGRDAKELRKNKELRRRAGRSQLIKVRIANSFQCVLRARANARSPTTSLSMRRSRPSLSGDWQTTHRPNLGQGAARLPSANIQSRAGHSTIALDVIERLLDRRLTCYFFSIAGACARGRRSAGGARRGRRGLGPKRLCEARDCSHGGSCARRRRSIHARTAFQARAQAPKGVNEKRQLARRRGRLRRRRGRSRRTHGSFGQDDAQAPLGRHSGRWLHDSKAGDRVRRNRCADSRYAWGEYFRFRLFSLAWTCIIISKTRVLSFP